MITFLNLNFSCEKCSAGHRPLTCTHLTRKQYELKQKGRPQTQCGNCRDNRKNTKQSSTHHQCLCGSSPHKKQKVEFIMNGGPSFTFKEQMSHIQSQKKSIELNSMICIVSVKRKDAKTKLETSEDIEYTLERVDILEQDKESLEEIERMIVNPCRCHSGDPCICSTLPAKPTKKPVQNNIYTEITNQVMSNLQSASKVIESNDGKVFLDLLYKAREVESPSNGQTSGCCSSYQTRKVTDKGSCCSISPQSSMPSLSVKDTCCCSPSSSTRPKFNPIQEPSCCSKESSTSLGPFKSNASVLPTITRSSCCSPNQTTNTPTQFIQQSSCCVSNESSEMDIFAEEKVNGCCCSTQMSDTKERTSCGCGCSFNDQDCSENGCIDTICDAGLEQFLKD